MEQPSGPADDTAATRGHLLALGKRIRAMRERKDLTQEQLAQRSGISVSFASLLERGERSPSYETLVAMSEALGVGLDELLRQTPLERHDDPYYARLLEFARKARLTRVQVDRWIAVGQAMLGLMPHDGKTTRAGREGACTMPGCDRRALAKGLCTSHYHRARRSRDETG